MTSLHTRTGSSKSVADSIPYRIPSCRADCSTLPRALHQRHDYASLYELARETEERGAQSIPELALWGK